MEKKFRNLGKRVLAAILSLTLIVGATNLVPMVASAEGGSEDYFYTANQLNNWYNQGATTTLDGTKLSIAYSGAYGQAQLGFPVQDGIDLTDAKSITITLSAQNCDLALKVHTDNDVTTSWGTDAEIIQYVNNNDTGAAYTIDLTNYTSTTTHVAITLNKDTVGESDNFACVVDSIYIDMKNAEELGAGSGEGSGEGSGSATTPTPDVSSEDYFYTANQLNNWYNQGATTTLDGTKLSIAYSGAYGQAQLGFPVQDGIDLTDAKSITITLSAQNCDLALKVHTDNDVTTSWGTDAEIIQYVNNNDTGAAYTIDLTNYTSTTTHVAITLNKDTVGESDNFACVVDSIYIDMKNDEELGGGSNEPTVDETPNATPAATSVEDKSWKASEMTGVSASSGSVTSLGGPNGDEWKISFNGQYGEWKIALPEEINLAMLDTLSFYVSEQNCSLSFKVYSGDREVKALYGYTGQTKYDIQLPGMTDVITHVGIMTGDTEAGRKCSLDGIYFDMLTKKAETYTETFDASDLTISSSDATSAQLVNDKWAVQFGALNQQVKFALPENINFAKCKAMIITVSEGQVGPVNFYAYSEGSDAGTFYYNIGGTVYTLSPNKSMKVDTVGVQCGGETYTANSAITIESIAFLMEGKKPLPLPEDTDGDGKVEVPPTFLVNYTVDENVTVEEVVVGGQTITEIEFTEANKGVDFEIPDTVDIAHLAKILFDIEVVDTSTSSQSLEGQMLNGVKLSLLDADKDPIVSGNVDILEVAGNENAKYIRIEATEPNKTVQVAAVTFELDMTIVGDIVKNGYFEDTNMDMWPNNIERVDAGSAFIPGEAFTTYGNLTSRDSNYSCFQQNIFSRVEPGKYYAITFWAKLSDDYAGQPANMRTVSFNPFHANAAGSDVYGQVPLGDPAEKVLEVGVWTKFSVRMRVPADATAFTIRIMEQGNPSDYGSGPGVKGSYAVAGIYMEECAPFAAVNNYGGGGSQWYDPRPVTFEQGYTMDDVVTDWASAVVEETAEGHLKLNFNNMYDEARFKLPRSYDVAEIVNFKVDIAGTNVPLALKLYSKGSMIDVMWINKVYDAGKTVQISPAQLGGSIDGFGIMCLGLTEGDDFAIISHVDIEFAQEPAPVPRRATIAANGDFSNEDLSDWHASYWGQEEGVSMFREVSPEPFGDGSTYFISYNKRTSPYQCFAQDITGYVEQNQIYTFSFWAKLSDDYIGAPDVQRVVQFAPYTVDKNGVADYNPTLEGTYIKTLEPGVWTKFEGKYKVTNANEIASVVIRILEQGTDYGTGDCVLGGYSIADFKMDVYVPEPPSIDEDVPSLDATLEKVFGDDFIVGNALALNTIDDIGTEMLLNKHFNAITIGNELKPDALFGYSNGQHTALETITFNGQELVVPTLNYSRAEMILDKILKWNKQNPNHQFKVRGHVLVWHSQTPEWFFRENYVVGQNADGTENYVSPELMSLRLEWYIKTVLEHFTGEDSEYKDLFYGWDVVNEAISDGSGNYRTDKVASGEKPSDPTHGSNSSWWAVYGSNEFIIKAFQYANKYAPADLELYYNDYNECDSKKVAGIVKLLQDVLAAEGTRIDAMGMQAHYNLMNPSNRMFEVAIRAYAAVVGNVQITEFDLKASRQLSNEKNIQDEYADQAKRYYELYEILKALNAEDGINITGITFWGASDKDSWLQSSSNVGGGSDGSMSQCPLLFDANYKVKPAFWAFVDYTVVDPNYKYTLTVVPDVDAPLADVEIDTEEVVTEEPKQDDEVVSDDVVAPQPPKTNALPFVVAGVVVAALAGATVWFFKKK